MSCDIRPTITSTATLYINPYQTPPRCPCRSSSSSPNYSSSYYHGSSTPSNSRPCPSHACCSLNLILYRCPAYCRQPTDYHQYAESSTTAQHSYYPQHTSRTANSYSYSYTNDHTYSYSPHYPYTSPRPRWRTIRVFDRTPDFHALESADLRFAISELVDIGGILLHAESELEKARLRADRERRRHDAAHGRSCERQRGQQRECDWTRRIAEMALEADDIKFSSEVLADCWVKYVGLLRKYESLGQRRVSGLIEDRGHRRLRRSGVEVEVEVPRLDKGKPFRYVSRESWTREKRVPEGDRECCREYKKGHGRPEANTGRRRSVRFADEVGGGKGYFNEGGRSRRWSVY
ncbi:uncharacterized protein CCOS01_13146 [Colletotrichum costaricense]|uniref:Uncharacterized protein n=1 Tax=Colletotrichum costaricense TaxID=1209916 RepID=A0AAI9YMX5_9PEZI|nr:uncharacterized protein CCOS01_13146 [Colletotrichum costaricense]KAK1515948.1 hypothetical protein CCOS01_13146 [Colletotrichum costaricense]